MKLLSRLVLVLCMEYLHCSDADARAMEPDSIEKLYAIVEESVVDPNLRLIAFKEFVKKQRQKDKKENLEALEQKDKQLEQKDKQNLEASKQKDEDQQFGRFTSSSCVIRDEVDEVFKGFVLKHCKNVITERITAPPEVVVGQLYNRSHEDFLFNSYPKWLSFTDISNSPLAVCFRKKLQQKNMSTKQLSWSAPKLYKFYNKYHRVSHSKAVVTFEKYLVMKRARNLYTTNQTLRFPPINSRADLKMFLSLMGKKKTFFEMLEENNEWFITNEDCQILNIIRQCNIRKEKVELECRPFKKSPNLVVPLFEDGYGEFYKTKCTTYIS